MGTLEMAHVCCFGDMITKYFDPGDNLYPAKPPSTQERPPLHGIAGGELYVQQRRPAVA